MAIRFSNRLAVLVLTVAPLAGCARGDLAAQEAQVKEEWTQLRQDIQRRDDLIPQVLEAANGRVVVEPAVGAALSESKARLAAATTPQEVFSAANQQASALSRLRAAVERAAKGGEDEVFNRVMTQLADADLQVAVERMRYNARVQVYDTTRRTLQGGLTAFVFRFPAYPFFMAPFVPGDAAPGDAKPVPSDDELLDVPLP